MVTSSPMLVRLNKFALFTMTVVLTNGKDVLSDFMKPDPAMLLASSTHERTQWSMTSERMKENREVW